MDRHLLTVVIASKNPPAAPLALCLASFAALACVGRLQLVLVESGTPATLDPQWLAPFAEVKRIEVPPEGVYAAYNAGIAAADGIYLLFFGIDDIALPGMDKVVSHLASERDTYHLFAAACYMQSMGLRRPSLRRTSLIVGNWCHQGIFYRRSHLAKHPYQVEYRAQADHKLNIDIVSDRRLRFGVSHELVAYFSAGGVSSVTPDLVFRKDFPAIVARAYGRPYGWLVRAKQLAIDLVLGPPEKRFRAQNKH